MSCCRPMHLEIADYKETIKQLLDENAKLREQRDQLIGSLSLLLSYPTPEGKTRAKALLAEIDSTAYSVQGEKR